MADSPDPLGKRALFWAPAERQEAGPRRPEKRIPPGRNALFSAAGTVPPTTAPKTQREAATAVERDAAAGSDGPTDKRGTGQPIDDGPIDDRPIDHGPDTSGGGPSHSLG